MIDSVASYNKHFYTTKSLTPEGLDRAQRALEQLAMVKFHCRLMSYEDALARITQAVDDIYDVWISHSVYGTEAAQFRYLYEDRRPSLARIQDRLQAWRT